MLPQMAELGGCKEEGSSPKGTLLLPSSSSTGKRTIAQDHQESPGPLDVSEQVVVVMDGLKEFSWEPLEWVLKNVADGASSSCNVTLLRVLPWLTITQASKTWSDIWSIDLNDLSTIKQYRNDAKYHKVRVLLDICQHYGVVLEIRTEMGHPLHLLVVEQISSLHATLVVFDRFHDRKFIEFYAEKVPCNMVKMKEDGQVDMIKTPRDDDSFNFVAKSVIFSERIKKFLKRKCDREKDLQDDYSFNSAPPSSRSVTKQSKKLPKPKYESFGKKNTETAPFGFSSLQNLPNISSCVYAL